MEDWNRNEHQGRTKKNIEAAWRINTWIIIALLTTLAIYALIN